MFTRIRIIDMATRITTAVIRCSLVVDGDGARVSVSAVDRDFVGAWDSAADSMAAVDSTVVVDMAGNALNSMF